jgi:hypothetical protein
MQPYMNEVVAQVNVFNVLFLDEVRGKKDGALIISKEQYGAKFNT